MLRFVLLIVSATLAAASGDSIANLNRIDSKNPHGQDSNGTELVEVHGPSRDRRTIRQVPRWLTSDSAADAKDFFVEALAQGQNGFCWRNTQNCPAGTYAWYDDGALIKTCVNYCPPNFRDYGE